MLKQLDLGRLDARPVQIPQWLLLSGVSAHAIMLYGLYKISLYRSPDEQHYDDLPLHPAEFVAALYLDTVNQYRAVHHELVAVGAIEECQETGDDGQSNRVILIHELSPEQKVEEEKRRRKFEELRAATEATSSPRTAGFVYLIRATGSRPVKIGYSVSVDKRLKNLQGSTPHQLELLWHTPGDRDLEQALHAEFHKYRLRGEWFDFGRMDPVKQLERAVQQLRDQ